MLRITLSLEIGAVKNKRMKNKGFTIIELLMALCLASVVVGLIFSLFTVSYRSYKSIRNNLELQFQSQYILNYMADRIMNSNSISLVRVEGSIYSMTYVRNAGTEYPINKISFKFGNNSDENYVFHIVNGDIQYTTGEKDANPAAELGKFVDSMYISLLKDGSFRDANAVVIKIVMKKDGLMYEAFQTVHMRNN